MGSLVNVGSISKSLLFLQGGRFVLKAVIKKNKKYDKIKYENEILNISDFSGKKYIDLSFRNNVEFIIGRSRVSFDTVGLEIFINKLTSIYLSFNKYFSYNDKNTLIVNPDSYDIYLHSMFDSKIDISFRIKENGMGAMFVINNSHSDGCYVSIDEIGAILSYFKKFDINNISLNLINTYLNSSDTLIFTDQTQLTPRG